ncbi:hypothetical protein J416_07642 [Gracilibacillus halophilus YIM-C55.5]|uniref:Membrane component n=1 Tax=Gracilibacillus halophilus YIM-C55.5 TaxID=1308866 RepID=N4WVG2_9BACI|nr:DUF1294 domain-containing protein [Gracilibacillus halophilus]ENH97051.1 hypothetical protein J416_07642 [Gracilibacillus halophilus YIM-C55.5]
MVDVMLIYLIVISFLAFLLMGMDKYKAVKGKWRIPEKKIWLCSLVGGAWGSTIGMYAFRHKINHQIFRWGLPFMAILQLVLFWKLS